MKIKIYCKQLRYGTHTFYLQMGGKEYYLFSQSYRKGVEDYFGRGVTVKESRNYSKSHHNNAIQRTMTKLPMYIKYVEREYQVEVFEQTKKRNKKRHHFYEMSCA